MATVKKPVSEYKRFM